MFRGAIEEFELEAASSDDNAVVVGALLEVSLSGHPSSSLYSRIGWYSMSVA